MLLYLEYPVFNPEIKKENDAAYIKCIIRKKWILFTPEEWVRQNFINFLLVEKHYPRNLVAVEKLFTVNGKAKRFDILIYNSSMTVQMLVECKRQDVSLNSDVWQQVLAYQSVLQSQFIVVTNGNTAIACNTLPTVTTIGDIPMYDKLQ